jgi:hypothetical protein
MGVGGQRHASAAFTAGKETRYPLYRRLGGPQGRSGRVRKISPPGFDPRTLQPEASRYTDYGSNVIQVAGKLAFTLQMEAACSLETSIPMYQSTLYYVP